PEELAQSNSNYIAAAHAFGKVSMASVAPHYWGCKQPSVGRRYFEFDGGEGIQTQWASIIANRPDWVEINTWNDFSESTYVSPVDNAGSYFPDLMSPRRYCHSAYLELSKRFITWYKSGASPTNNTDLLCYFSRTHPKNAVALDTNDVPVTWWVGDAQDRLYTTTFLTAPSQLEISSGGTVTTNSLPAGWSNFRTSFSSGSQTFTVRRSGLQVLSVKGPDILASITNYDFFPASGYAYRVPSPPEEFRVVGPQ